LANGNGTDTSKLVGWRKILATALMIGIPVINGSIVGLNIKPPEDYEIATLIIWGVTVIVELSPTIATLIAGGKYINANTAQNIAGIKAQAKVDTANAMSATVPASKPAITSVPETPVAQPEPAYKPVDIKEWVSKAEAAAQGDGLKVDPTTRATYFYPMVANYDLRNVPRSKRAEEGLALVTKCLDLYIDSFKFQTGLPEAPTQAESNNLNVYMLKLKHDWEKSKGMTCSDNTFDQLRGLVSYFNDLYSAKYGLEQLVGKTVDWSIYGSGAFTPTQVGWDYAKLI